MSSGPRFVFDTNVLVSALLFENSGPGKAFFQALEVGEILLSLESINELADVLSRPKFDRYLEADAREQFVVALVRKGRLVAINRRIDVCRDARDNTFLELAVCGQASTIVTGDEDLLALDPFEGVRILMPADFLKSSKEALTRLEWKPVAVVTEEQPLTIQGVNPWMYEWKPLNQKAHLYHPSYPEQREILDIYEIDTPTGRVIFAAGEVSANVWAFFEPRA